MQVIPMNAEAGNGSSKKANYMLLQYYNTYIYNEVTHNKNNFF